ncbi:hypothetical protein NP493_941g00000 [Ridgeia piscesae]|uniref:Zinc transporter ZIP13 n=1 Tax=Ridgeia piscesae TaxID=27915 RepID=A0AAD9KJW3_RIDPI|nr:hypothetical protein NP493_941g00000 [Ridgeia piscesae]
MQWWKLSFFLQKTDSPPTHGASVCRCQYKRCQSQGPILRHVTSSLNTNSNSHPGHCDCMNGYHVVSNGQVVNGLMTHRTGECDRSAKDTKGVTKQHIKTCGWLNLFANVVDNFTHGLAVAGSYSVGTKTGILTTMAILLHELPHEVGDFAILLRSGFDRWQAAKAQLITASGALIGALAALIAESAQEAGNRTAWILPFTAGGFIYIALVSLVPELLKENDWRESLKQLVLLCSGVTVMALVTFLSD